jgi:hypothetical protein
MELTCESKESMHTRAQTTARIIMYSNRWQSSHIQTQRAGMTFCNGLSSLLKEGKEEFAE